MPGTSATPTVTTEQEIIMTISAEMKMHVAALGNDKNWPKCPSTDLPTWTFINDIQEMTFDLVATIRSDKCGGTTGHLGLVMSLAEFATLNPAAPLFPHGTHPGVLDFTGATTVNQHTERRLEHGSGCPRSRRRRS